MLRPCTVLSLTALAGCLGASDAGPLPTQIAPIALAPSDAQGARYASAAIPRDPTLRLQFGRPPPATPGVRLWRGQVHPALAAALQAGGRARQPELDVPVTIAHEARALVLTPTAALLPGARYTLVWGDADAPLTFPLTVSASPALGAAAVATVPADQTRGVPRNLARALVRFDGEVAADSAALAAHLVLRAADGSEVPSRLDRAPCEALDLPAGTCVARTPDAPLAPGSYTLDLAAGLRSLTGASIAGARATFEVVAEDDLLPPSLEPVRCDPDEDAMGELCVRADDRALHVRGRAREPVEVALLTGACAALGADGSFALQGCTRASVAALTLRLRDHAGNVRDVPLALPPPPVLAAISIDELRADPRGKEPAQEYVELLSSAPHPVSLMGFSLRTDSSQSRGRAVLGSPTLMPGERALLVGPGFDAADPRDGPLPAGVRMLPLDGPLGLSNEGTRVVLRDAAGRRLSAAMALPPWLEGQCSARSTDDPRAGDAIHFALDPDGACTPGAATFSHGQ